LAAEGLDEEPAALEEVYSPLPGLNFLVLATGGRVKDTPKGSDNKNDSLVLMLYCAGRMVLLAGDIESERSPELKSGSPSSGTPRKRTKQ
jgi:beta-lactamase superfamily II metal-dependent hydrolase